MPNQPTTILPEPTTARAELPTPAAVSALEIDLPLNEARLVLAALSWLMADGRSRSRDHLYFAIQGLVAACTRPLTRFEVTQPAPHPDLPTTGWPKGQTAFRTLEITHRDLTRYWLVARDRADDTCYPVGWVMRFFPAVIWPAVATLIKWGPDQSYTWLEQAVRAMASEVVTRNARRRTPGGPPALNTVENRVSGVWRLMRALVDLRLHAVAAPQPHIDLDLLGAWTHRPKRVDAKALGIRPSNQDNSGPSLDECAARLQELIDDYQAAPKRSRYFRLRRIILLSLLCLFGGRADALRRLRVGDVLPHHVFPDGTTGNALRLTPEKTWEEDQPHILLVPDELCGWLEQWIALNSDDPHAPLFPSNKGRGFLGQHGFYAAVAGHHCRDGGSRALLPNGDDRYQGRHPHAFRHLAYQVAVRAATILQKEAAHPELAHVHPEEYARALVGHKLDGSVSATYRDLDRQRLAAAVIPYMWQLLRPPPTQRTGPDPQRIRRERSHCEALEAAIATLTLEAEELHRRADRAADRARRAPNDGALALFAHALDLREQAGAKDRLKTDYQEQLRHAREELERAKTTHIPIPTSILQADYPQDLADALGEPPPPRTEPDPNQALADLITSTDFAEVMDTTPQTVGRWRRDGFPASLRPLWDDGAWITESPKRHWLIVDRIHLDTLSPGQKLRLDAVRRRRWLG